MVTATQVLTKAASYLGVKEGSLVHRAIVDGYNGIQPLPQGYRVSYTDSWCDVFVTFVMDQVGGAHLIGRECGVQRHIQLFKSLGIWKVQSFPKTGDVVCFDWEKNGFSDHIGFVERIANNQITTIEGNSNGVVARRTYAYNDWRISGYARPAYPLNTDVKKTIDEVAREVIRGDWGSGNERLVTLNKAGYDATQVQLEVNRMMTTPLSKQPQKVRIRSNVSHWATGEMMPEWIKAYELIVVEQRQHKECDAFVVARNQVVVGVVYAKDVEQIN